jgi:hypothetical protein
MVLYCTVLQAVIYEELLQINPGSATGAYSTFTDSVQPSFVLMDLDGSKVRPTNAPECVRACRLDRANHVVCSPASCSWTWTAARWAK